MAVNGDGVGINFIYDSFTGDGTTTQFQLSTHPGEEDDILVTIDGIVQRPVKDYTISVRNLNFGVAPFEDETIGVRILSGLRANWVHVDSTPYDASRGEFLLVRTTDQPMTVNLPADAVLGSMISVIDYAGNAQSRNITLNPGSKFLLSESNNPLIVDVNNAAFEMLYSGDSHGWVFTEI